MDVKTIRETVIKPKLVEIFGNTMGSLILTSGILAASDGKTDEERLDKMVETICSDPEVISMWGQAGADRQKQEWLHLL